jgi:RimJ/RimL family protein N-acetyltransferase
MNYSTERLLLNELESTDTAFIVELLNTPGWIQFIGNRNINTLEDADAYIQKVKGNPGILYWVVRLKETMTAVGIISFIKRNYLDFHDIGFAYLPQYNGKGYAYEAAAAVLADKLHGGKHPVILATTRAENTSSIQLLLKLGFVYNRDVLADNEKLLLYAIETKKQ